MQSDVLSIKAALAQAASEGLDRLDIQLILGHVLQRDRAWLLAHDDTVLDRAQRRQFHALCAERREGVPVAYLIGHWGFQGLTLQVHRAVLVPRPETEGLVEWAEEKLAALPGGDASPAVLDLGSGSGAIALAVKRRWPSAKVCGVERSATALELARANAASLGLQVDWRLGDWWSPVLGSVYALVLSNPPYIAEGDPHLSELRHEPRMALTSGPDGLDAIREITAGALDHLLPGAWLLLEHGWDQAAAVRELLRANGFVDVCSRRDLSGHERYTGGCRPVAQKSQLDADDRESSGLPSRY